MLIPYIIIAVLLIVLVWVIFGNIKLTSENIELAEEVKSLKDIQVSLTAKRAEKVQALKATRNYWQVFENVLTKQFEVSRIFQCSSATARIFSYADDGDRDYALLLAEELCDKLNEGL